LAGEAANVSSTLPLINETAFNASPRPDTVVSRRCRNEKSTTVYKSPEDSKYARARAIDSSAVRRERPKKPVINGNCATAPTGARKSRSSMAIVRQHLPGRATFDKIGGKCPRGAIGYGEKSQLKTYGECSASCRVQDKELFQQLLAIGRHVEGDSVLSAQHALSQFLTRKNAQSC